MTRRGRHHPLARATCWATDVTCSRATVHAQSEATLQPRWIAFPGGHRAQLVEAGKQVPASAIVSALGLSSGPLLLVHGGTTEIEPRFAGRLEAVLHDGVAKAVVAERVRVMTGGTAAGIFTALGRALEAAPPPALIGVAVAARVTWPGRVPAWFRRWLDRKRVPLEPHHTHFMLVQGNDWGDETPTMLALADALSAQAPSVALLAGGGAVARQEVMGDVRAGREVVALAGTGRFADELAKLVRGEVNPSDAAAEQIVRSQRLILFDIDRPPEELANLLARRLATHPVGRPEAEG
jgi:SLOG in TRPM, prokaryote